MGTQTRSLLLVLLAMLTGESHVDAKGNNKETVFVRTEYLPAKLTDAVPLVPYHELQICLSALQASTVMHSYSTSVNPSAPPASLALPTECLEMKPMYLYSNGHVCPKGTSSYVKRDYYTRVERSRLVPSSIDTNVCLSP